jgi:hypothetical protein
VTRVTSFGASFLGASAENFGNTNVHSAEAEEFFSRIGGAALSGGDIGEIKADTDLK